MATIYARFLNQCKFKNHILFSANFYNVIEEDQRIDEIELFINLINNQNLTETDNIDVDSQLEHQTQIKETKESGRFFDKIN